ncbi:MAG: hypothetical protein ACLQVY_21860 [Limisphaerales bacterium]
MAWIKRNLFFVIFAVIGLGVTGYGGYLLSSAVRNNRSVSDEYSGVVSQLKDAQKPPLPTKENIEAAKADQERVKAFLADFSKAFAPLPEPPKEDEQGFKDFLQSIIYRWGMQATNAGVLLPDNYAFSFSSIKDKLTFPAESIPLWMQQIEEIKVLLNILYKAKILYLEGVQRCPVSPEDYQGNDCIYTAPTTNAQVGIITPYKVAFRGFSTEIAAVLSGFAAASNCFIVKDIDVAPSRAPLPVVVPPPANAPPPPENSGYRNPTRFRGRGEGEDYNFRRPPPRQQQIAPVAVEPVGPQTILSESLLYVTISVDLIRPKPEPKPEPKPADAAKPKSRGAARAQPAPPAEPK